ncbi:arabinofuranosyltransferase [Trujillonella humicola]|uniref:arabinofuranosyltransferase n=1 Tax=Trujillonella humicola TaxID=3383699 RepID=UPI003905BB59
MVDVDATGPARAAARPVDDGTAADGTAAEEGTTTAAGAGEATPPRRRRHRLLESRRAPLLPWVLLPLGLAAAYSLLPPGSDLRSQYQVSVLVLVAGPVLALLLTRTSALAHHTAAALVAGLLPALTLISLHGTDWFFSGVQGDQTFRLEYAARLADDPALADYTYAGAPAFYSPGWFWLVGLAARVTGTEAWRVYKWAAVVTLYLAAVVAFALWRRTCGTRLSAALLVATVIGLPSHDQPWLWDQTLLFAGAYEPYAWLVALPLPALLVWYAATRGGSSLRRGAVLGLAVGVAAWLYLLYAAVLALAVAVVCLARRRGRRPAELAAAGATALLLVSPWLGPFLVEWFAAGRPTTDALTFVDPDDSYVRLVDVAASPWLVLALAGAVALIAVDASVHRRMRGLVVLAGTVGVLGLAQAVLGQAGRGVLFHRLLLILGITLLAAGTLALHAVYPRLRGRLAAAAAGVLRRPHRVAVAALTVLLVLGMGGHAREWTLREDTEAELRRLAMETRYPDGSFPRLASPESRAEAEGEPSLQDLEDAARRVAEAAGQPEPGPVLTDNVPLLATTALHGYQQWWALYANPLGRYAERRAFLEGLAGLPADRVVPALRAEPGAPAVFVLQRVADDPDSVRYASTDYIPSRGGSTGWEIRLPVTVFGDPAFETTTVGTWVVAALRPASS